jgi:hypothetical protein
VITGENFSGSRYLNAGANALKGKGYEDISALGGPTVAKIIFCGIGNIHVMRSSFQSLVAACSADARTSGSSGGGGGGGGGGDFHSQVAASKWLDHVALVLQGSSRLAHSLDEGHPCVVHCSDGWDRTSQLSAMAQLLLDPYYRTIGGFAALVEKDWLAFGHKFGGRCGGDGKFFLEHESSPIFLQWLDAVHQCCYQFPAEFEFGSDLLVYLAEATYSKWFGTFLHNSEKERWTNGVLLDTLSVWDYVESNHSHFVNPVYRPTGSGGVLPVDSTAASVVLWRGLFQRMSPHDSG